MSILCYHITPNLASDSALSPSSTLKQLGDGGLRHMVERGVVLVVREAQYTELGEDATLFRARVPLAALRELATPIPITIIDGSGERDWNAGHAHFTQLITQVEQGAVGLVWARDNDRFGRGSSALVTIKPLLRSRAVPLFLGWPEVKIANTPATWPFEDAAQAVLSAQSFLTTRRRRRAMPGSRRDDRPDR